MTVEGAPYYRLIPFFGQTIHRIICYGLFFVSVIIFARKARRAPRIYSDKYSIILMSMVIAGAIETYYIFSRTPIDMSMVAFGVFGVLAYYFTLIYKPVRLLDRMLSSVVSDMSEAMFFFDKMQHCIWANDKGKKVALVVNDNYSNVKANLEQLYGELDYGTSGWSRTVDIGEGDEASYYFLEGRPVLDRKGNKMGMMLSVRDDTDSHREMMQRMYDSTHDALTGLYTNEYLVSCIEKQLSSGKDEDYLILYVNISNYTIINDVFGREFGTLTLKTLARYIRSYGKGRMLYGKVGEHTFEILIRKDKFKPEPLNDYLKNFTISDNGMEHSIVLHIGVYDVSVGGKTDVPMMFENARLATLKITEDHPGHIAYYDDLLRKEIVYDQLISTQVQEAIRQRQIRPYLQPIVDNNGQVVGAEALVRWIHPDEGFLSPAAFIPVFERNGLIAQVDRYMWRCACEILSDWKKRGINKFLSVNISPKDFYFLDVFEEIRSLIREFDIEPEQLRVEITETVMMTDSPDRLKIVSDFRNAGFIVEMDDFGSGFSSLNLLKDMPVDVLKIDMQFLRDSDTNIRANTIIRNIISMSQDLSIVSLTEGVETSDQFKKLVDMGCRLFQGYYFSKPVPVEQFESRWIYTDIEAQ